MQDVRGIMSTQIVAIGAGDLLLTAHDIMRLGDVRHMPVVRSGRLVGVVSERDLLRALPSHLGDVEVEGDRRFLNSVSVSRVMSSPAIVIDAKATVREAARVMAEKKIGCLPVMDDMGRLLGIVTEIDILRVVAEGH